MNNEIPYTRTVCACGTCIKNCKTQPGYLVPGDVKRITEFTGKPAHEILVNSPGATVLEPATGEITRIRSITPAMDETGRCIFLTPDDKCAIHPVSPFGCAYFDCGMSGLEAYERALWGVQQSMNPAYQKLRELLPLAKSSREKSFFKV